MNIIVDIGKTILILIFGCLICISAIIGYLIEHVWNFLTGKGWTGLNLW